MQQCANCGHQNRAGIVFCENCGASLIGKMPLNTKSLDSSTDEEKAQLGIDASVLTDVEVQGITTFEEGSSLRLDIHGSSDPILFKPKTETIFGRRDPATGAMPDVDLTPFAGYRMGVSRRHAAIRTSDDQGLDLWDLGSSNGTFLNDDRLNPHRPYRLHDGDEIRLGSMNIRIYFQRDDKSSSKSGTGELVEPSATAQPSSPQEEPHDAPAEASSASSEPASESKATLANASKPDLTPGMDADDEKPENASPASADEEKSESDSAT